MSNNIQIVCYSGEFNRLLRKLKERLGFNERLYADKLKDVLYYANGRMPCSIWDVNGVRIAVIESSIKEQYLEPILDYSRMFKTDIDLTNLQRTKATYKIMFSYGEQEIPEIMDELNTKIEAQYFLINYRNLLKDLKGTVYCPELVK